MKKKKAKWEETETIVNIGSREGLLRWVDFI